MNTISLVGAMLVVLFASCNGDGCTPHTNGCSIPYNLPYFFKSQFTPACNRHDICYQCAAGRGMTRKQCDDAFYSRMTSVCNGYSKRFIVSEGEVEKTVCDVVRGSYYEAVRWGGASHFSTVAQLWCSESWVNSCF